MPKSMTGYGRAQLSSTARDVLVELRAVNHRYYEFSARVPRAFLYLEEKLKGLLSGKIARGKVEISVSITHPQGNDEQIAVNKAVAERYLQAMRELNETLHLEDDLTLSRMLSLPDIFQITKETEDEEDVWADVSAAAEEALVSFLQMREAEGERLAADLLGKLNTLEQMLQTIEQAEPQIVESYRERLLAKLKELLADHQIEEQRILTEAAIFAEKTAVDEETVRLHSHIEQFRTLLASEGAIGRKLDFLVQEMNREVNTIGSKSQDLRITRLVVEMKSELEKIREQIQNIE